MVFFYVKHKQNFNVIKLTTWRERVIFASVLVRNLQCLTLNKCKVLKQYTTAKAIIFFQRWVFLKLQVKRKKSVSITNKTLRFWYKNKDFTLIDTCEPKCLQFIGILKNQSKPD